MEEDCEYKDSDYNKTEPVKLCAKVTKWTFILYNLLLLVISYFISRRGVYYMLYHNGLTLSSRVD